MIDRTLLLSAAVLATTLAVARPSPAGPATTQAAGTRADLKTIQDRFVRSVIPTDARQLKKLNDAAAKYAAEQKADGSWSDINYTRDERSAWTPREHLLRTLTIAKASRAARDAGKPDDALHRAVINGLSFWTANDFKNPNWWWNQIGVPQLTSEIATLALPDVPQDQVDRVITICKRSTWAKWTGQNLVWGVENQVLRGCLERDPAVVDQAYRRMYQEVRVVTPKEEGIQPDASFHQHGKQLYNGGYGLAFANDVGRFVAYSWGTPYQIPADKMQVLNLYLLDGEQWMVRGNVFDYSAVGREITRKDKVAVPDDWRIGPISPAGPAYSLGSVITMLSQLPVPRREEYAQFSKRLHGDPDAAPFEGHKTFWCSDYASHRRAGYLVSVKMLSDRIMNGEITNDEGKKSQHLSDGVTLLYLTGNEYKNIMPVWDWQKLPGTTTLQAPLERKDVFRRGQSPFTGGVGDGRYGLAAMDLKQDRLQARKVWAFFDDAYVCLGAGIASDASELVATSANQCLLHGDVTTSSSASPLSQRAHELSGPTWVHHDNVGYVFPSAAKLHLSNADQSGTWADLGTGSPDTVSIPVFNLWIDHGAGPKDGTYEYVVLPGASAEQTRTRAKDTGIQVIANRPELQAVFHPGLKIASVAFWKSGSVETPAGTIAVDQPCLLLVRDTPDGRTVTASNPENKPLTLNVTVAGKSTTLELPDGPTAGSSVTRRINGQ